MHNRLSRYTALFSIKKNTKSLVTKVISFEDI